MTTSTRILLVDDYTRFVPLVEDALSNEQASVQVLTEQTTGDALDRVATDEIDCLITTDQLQDGEGFDFLQTVSERHPWLPTFLVTNDFTPGLTAEVAERGVTDCFDKELLFTHPELVLHRIETAIESTPTLNDYQAVFDTVEIPMNIRDLETGELLDANQHYCELLGYSYEDLINLGFDDITADLPGYSAAKARSMFERAVEEGSNQFEWPEQTSRGEIRWVNVKLTVIEIEGQEYMLVAVHDIHERRQREQRLEALQSLTRDAIEADSRKEVCEYAVEAARELLGIEANSVHLYNSDSNTLEPVAMTPEVRDIVGDPPSFAPGNSIAWRVFDQGEPALIDDVRSDPDIHNPETAICSEIHLPLGEHGLLIGGSTDHNAFTETDLSFGEILASNIQTALTNVDREIRLKELQARTTDLMRSTSEQEIAVTAADAAEAVLDLPYVGVHLANEEMTVLEPTAVSEAASDTFGSGLAYDKHDSESISQIVWETFENGETVVAEDTTSHELFAEYDGEAKSGLIYPLGDHGLCIASSPDPHGFDETDQALGEVLATTLTAALDRAEREAQLRAREQELEREVERLDQFASIVSHDLRNPLNVADGYLSLARESCDCEEFEDIQYALDRATEITDNVLTLARAGDRVESTEPTEIGAVAATCWRTVATDEDFSLIVEENLTIHADKMRLQHIFENLFRNAVEHAGSAVTVTIGALDEAAGFYVEDNGKGIPEELHENTFSKAGSNENAGFGLMIIGRMADAHGWGVELTESDTGGARFEFTGVQFVD